MCGTYSFALKTLYYSFYELFAHYAKHLERYFSTIDPSEKICYISEFHDVLMQGINEIAQERCHSQRYDSPSTEDLINSEMLERMIIALDTADKELSNEHTLRHTLQRFEFPNSVYQPQPEEHPLEYEIYKRCFSHKNSDEE
jgi:hypothetical protein